MVRYQVLIFLTILPLFAQGACPNACSGHGRCNKYNTCNCYKPFYGHDCSDRYCPKGRAWGVVSGSDEAHQFVECSGRGICDSSVGVCTCQRGFAGDACQLVKCPDDCSAHGSCISMANLARSHKHAYEHHNGKPYVYNSIWDANKIQGCVCDPFYRGNNCAQRTCPTGDDPLSTGQTEEVQIIQCSSRFPKQRVILHFDATPKIGKFILKYGRQYTRPINFDAPALNGAGTSVSEMLISGIQSISSLTSVSRTTTASSTTWDITFPSNAASSYVLRAGFRRIEVQSLFCAADGGHFSMYYLNSTYSLKDIPYNTDEGTLKQKLKSLAVFHEVNVQFSTNSSQVCTLAGNTITISFVKVFDRNHIGDIPELNFDSTNGNKENRLTRTNSVAYLDGRAKEIVKGIDSCQVIEQQRLYCRATSGSMSFTFENKVLYNISFDTSTSTLATNMKSAFSTSIFEVDIYYTNGTSACTSTGNYIHIHFTYVSTEGAKGDGDLTEITVDKTNNNIGSPLAHSTSASLSVGSSFVEVVKGTTCVPLDQGSTTNDHYGQIQTFITEGSSYFRVSYGGFTTKPILTSSTVSDVKRIIQNLRSVNDIEVSFSGSTACEIPKNIIRLNFTQNPGDLPTITVDNSTLSSGSTISVHSGGEVVGAYESFNGTKENWVCSGRGVCDSKLGSCTCSSGYTNSDGRGNKASQLNSKGDCGSTLFTIGKCPGEIACSGHGFCSGPPQYQCTCASGWTNGECSERLCATGIEWFGYPSASNKGHIKNTECSSAGTCDRTTGICVCPPPFTGAACEKMACGGENLKECSGHGQCLTLAEIALEATVNGENAGFTYGTNPNKAETWDYSKIRSCLCDPPYMGYDCSLRECPRGDDPSTFEDKVEVQLIKCNATGGSFTLAFRDQVTKDIPFNAGGSLIKTELELLSTVGEVAVTYSSGSKACVSTGTPAIIKIEFVTELGNLPALKLDKAKLTDNTFGDGSLGSGKFQIATDGAAIDSVHKSATGTRENDLCSNHGKCNFRTGICKCDPEYASSDGKGGVGDKGDCGYHSTVDTV